MTRKYFTNVVNSAIPQNFAGKKRRLNDTIKKRKTGGNGKIMEW